MSDSLNIKRINDVFHQTINAIETGREEIIDISENIKKEYTRIEEELSDIKKLVDNTTKEVDFAEIEERKARFKLATVSKNFDIYSEQDIKDAYEEANDLRIKLILLREKEKTLLERRYEYELRLKANLDIMKKADNVNKKIGVAVKYLQENTDQILLTIDDLGKRQYLGIKIIEGQEEERERVARDIHDGPAQSMANILIKAELCEKLQDLDKERAKVELGNLKTIVRETLKDVRKIIYDLRPMSLDDLGLKPTLERYIYNYMKENSIIVKLNVIGDISDVNSTIGVAVFRVIQEALANVKKHSQASICSIVIEKAKSRLNVIISDNGVGFDCDNKHIEYEPKKNGFGLISMRERIELLDGELQIKSSPGKGTKLYFYIPFVEEELYV